MLHRLLAVVRGPGSRRGWRKGSPARGSASAAAAPPVALPAQAQPQCPRRSDRLSAGHRPAAALRTAIATVTCPPRTEEKRAWLPKGVQEGGVTGYTRTGSIFLAQTQDRLISLKRISSRLNVVGIPCEIVSPRKVAELHPLLNVHDLVGAMHVPEDAVVSSADVALALASAASQSGVQIYDRTSILHVMVKRGQVTGVETDKGQIQCQYFVNCAGQWAYELGLCSEEPVSIPLHACEHFYLLTRPWETPLPSSTPKPLLSSLLRRMPQLETLEIMKLVNCPETFTPDMRYIMAVFEATCLHMTCRRKNPRSGGTSSV
ncbi:hypothetical protein AB1E19_012885 [Capra hircus]